MGVMNAKILLEFLPADIAGLSPLAHAALSGDLSVPGVRVARSCAEVKQPTDRFEPDARANLAKRLEEAISSVSPPVAVLDSLRALAQPGACAVVTGQQPGLACGPLYSVWKGLQAIALAKQLSKEWGTPVVPMFWNHADDHDIAEVHHAWLLNRNVDLQKASLAGLSSGRQPFSKIYLEEERHKPTAFAALLRSVYGDYPHIDEAVEAFAPRAGETLARAFTRGMTALLGRHGLVVFEPEWIREDLSSGLSRLGMPFTDRRIFPLFILFLIPLGSEFRSVPFHPVTTIVLEEGIDQHHKIEGDEEPVDLGHDHHHLERFCSGCQRKDILTILGGFATAADHVGCRMIFSSLGEGYLASGTILGSSVDGNLAFLAHSRS